MANRPDESCAARILNHRAKDRGVLLVSGEGLVEQAGNGYKQGGSP